MCVRVVRGREGEGEKEREGERRGGRRRERGLGEGEWIGAAGGLPCVGSSGLSRAKTLAPGRQAHQFKREGSGSRGRAQGRGPGVGKSDTCGAQASLLACCCVAQGASAPRHTHHRNLLVSSHLHCCVPVPCSWHMGSCSIPPSLPLCLSLSLSRSQSLSPSSWHMGSCTRLSCKA